MNTRDPLVCSGDHNGTHKIAYIHDVGPCSRNPSLDTLLLTQPRNKAAYLNKCCEQKYGKAAPPKQNKLHS